MHHRTLAAMEAQLVRDEPLSIAQQRDLLAEVRRLRTERPGGAGVRAVESAEVRQIRNALARAVERDGLRPTARAAGAYIEGGLAPTGLQKFLDGGIPYERTMAGYRLWLVHEAQAGAVAVDTGVQRTAMAVLLRDLSPLERELVRAAVRRQYRERGEGVPDWLMDTS